MNESSNSCNNSEDGHRPGEAAGEGRLEHVRSPEWQKAVALGVAILQRCTLPLVPRSGVSVWCGVVVVWCGVIWLWCGCGVVKCGCGVVWLWCGVVVVWCGCGVVWLWCGCGVV